MKNNPGLYRVGVFVLAVTACSVIAQPSDKQSRKGGQPPEVAINACSGQSVSASCEFEHRGRSLQGVCEYTPDDQYFACKPDKNGKKQGGGKGNRVTEYPSHLKTE